MKLYVVGIGPGDPELITLKAKKILESVNTIFCPKGGKDSIALSIVEKTIDLSEKKIITLQFPMLKTKQQNLVKVWNELAENIIEQATEDSAFITLGDPSFYCTFFYLYEYLKDKIQIELIPGVSSINASSCRLPASLALGDERIAIVPANYHREIDFYIENFDTIVLMKPHKTLDRIKKALKTKNCRVFYIKKATMPEEAIFSGLDEIKESDLDYFSMVVIKK